MSSTTLYWNLPGQDGKNHQTPPVKILGAPTRTGFVDFSNISQNRHRLDQLVRSSVMNILCSWHRIFIKSGSATVQAVDQRPRAAVSGLCGICGKQSGNETVLSPTASALTYQYHFKNAAYSFTHSSLTLHDRTEAMYV